MKLIVPDASVAAKWFLPRRDEPLVEEAIGILRRYERGQIGFLVPGLFWAEIANIFWKAARLRRWPQQSAATAAGAMLERKFPTVPDAEILADSLSIALAENQTVYDSLYVALAMRYNVEMVTADERLANALAARLPVKWLGAFR